MAEQIDAILNDKDALREVALAAFDAVDTDGSGAIDAKELKTVMETVAKDMGADQPSDDDVDEVFKELDTDKTGKINVDQFTILIKQVLEGMKAQASA
eukprot:CAMPEP_0172862502 /NCGR_PEP_ID=MMETSP1075-20121228/74430_1 /TAXON_ID=2916 /ORGANISM="Ceratium fusus, Strain PA161109" /LENGTH=97 /DNA_ID=CAMNT_0013710853 /DNA_START=30 /DNA_END=323 /DNA_ORIENTATION=-